MLTVSLNCYFSISQSLFFSCAWKKRSHYF